MTTFSLSNAPSSTLFPGLSPQQDPNYNNAFRVDFNSLRNNTSPIPDYAKQFAINSQNLVNRMKADIGLTFASQGSPSTQFLGKEMLQQSIDNEPTFITPTKEKIPFSTKFMNSTFGKNSTQWNSAYDMANSIVTGIFGEKDEYSGSKGHITRTMDNIYDNIKSVANNFGPVGMAVSQVMGASEALGNLVNGLGGGTDGMSTTDAILGSSFLSLTPFGLINGFGGKRADTITKNDEVFEQVGSSYTGSESTVNDASSKSGKKYGLFSSGAREEANRLIAEAKRQQSIIENIADEATNVFAASNSMAAINGNRRKYYLQGGYNQADVRVGKSGMSLDLIAKAKKVLHESRKLKGGGQITPTEILLVVPEFQDGGQINKKSRTLQELIEYAKKENPRFIQRMSEPPRGIDFVDDEGKQARGSHYMEWSTDDNGNAIIYPRIQEVDKELKFFNSSDAYNRALENKNYLIMTPEEAKLFFAEDSKYGTAYKSGWPQFFGKFQQGGSINIIPEGALHAHKHNMDMEGITPKGIPVVSNKEGGEVEQQAEIEREEIIFRLEVTKKLEELEEKYYDEETSQREKDECALEAGKLLVEEILYNTQDNTNKLL